MPQLHTSLHFHLTPIVMINDSSHRDLLLNSQNFCHSIPAGTENPLPSRLCYRRLWGSRNRRALIIGWAYYLDAFSSYPLRTWLPSVFRGHDNWYTREWYLTDGSGPPEGGLLRLPPKLRRKSPKPIPGNIAGPGHCDPLCEEAPLLPKLRGYFAEFLRESCLAPLGILYLPTCVGFGYRYPFVEGRSSFSWEYSMGYFSAVAPGTRTLARGIFSTPSYPEKALTHPLWTNLAEEPLGFRGIGFSPMFALLKPTFSLPLRLLPLTRVLPPKAERSPTDAFLHPTASADRLAPFIFGARALDHHLRALAGDPGCFPLDDEAYPPSSHWPTSTPVILRSYLVFRVCLDLVPLSWPAPKQCFTPRCPVNCCTSTHFGENQLALGMRSEPWAPPTAWELTVSCSISLPDGGSFHPSLTQQFERLTYSGISGSTLIFNSPKHFVAYYALPRLWVPRILVVPEDPATGEPGTESFPPSDSLVLRMLVLRMSNCPSPTLTAQPES
ncbi:hypothetical protein V6N11_011993 [Hibiscus sabdariffa]|uniref:Uncharacterized protein n=1 Tax=Hibiscus sabdariffa TaxID=183260 RepID=A0ABR2P9Q2_9ROSI